MPFTYTWEVTSIQTTNVDDINDFVVQTHWKKIGTDEHGNIGEFIGATPFDTDEMDSESIVPFDQLTEEVVLGWIRSVVVGTYEEHVNGRIQKQITSKQVVEKPLPWNPDKPLTTITPATGNESV